MAFDWDRWNRDMDRMSEMLERLNEAETQITQAHLDMLRDMRGIIENIGGERPC